jgi:hypothetical protein
MGKQGLSLKGPTFHSRGEMMLASAHAQQGRALYNLAQHRTLGLSYGFDPGVLCMV